MFKARTFNGALTKLVMLLSVIFLPTIASAQSDETIVLNCTYTAGGRLVVQLHLGDKTVDIERIYPSGNQASKGSITSTTDQEVAWTSDAPGGGTDYWTLNRYTGDFTVRAPGGSEGVEFRGSCSKVQKQF